MKEAIKLVIEAMEKHGDAYLGHSTEYYSALEKAKEALAQSQSDVKQEQSTKCVEPVAEPHKGEPVAAQCKFDTEQTWGWCSIEHHNLVQSAPSKWPKYQTRLLYTTLQQRPSRSDMTWVGLSVFEINDLVENTEFDDYHGLVETVEAKLKEKNT